MIKICGLTNIEDALTAWRAGADLLGFILVPESPRYIRPERLAQITRTLREQACDLPLVGVFAHETSQRILETVAQCNLDLAQLHGESGDLQRELDFPYIVALRVTDDLFNVRPTSKPWAFLLDSHVPGQLGGTGKTWPWRPLSETPYRDSRVFLAGGLTPDNVRRALLATRPWGIDVSSGIERTPGYKDHDKLTAFIQIARTTERELAEEIAK